MMRETLFSLPRIKRGITFGLWGRIYRLPRYFIAAWQLREFQRVARSAYRHVPFYRKLWDEYGVRPDDIKTLRDIHRLPITTKQLFRAHPFRERLHDLLPKARCVRNCTSGFTGEPFDVAYWFGGEEELKYLNHGRFRFLDWQKDRGAVPWHSVRVAQIGAGHFERPNYHFIHMSRVRTAPDAVFRELGDFRPDVLEGFLHPLLELARRKEEFADWAAAPFRYLSTHGDAISPRQQDFLASTFGVPVYDRYGSAELGTMGVQCGARSGFHLNEESLFVEVLDEDDAPLPAGAIGRLVFTSFYGYNDAMPFIRYAIGDHGMIINEPCACGLRTRRVVLAGRSMGSFIFGGKRFFSEEFREVLDKLGSDIMFWQIAKIAGDKLELRVVPFSSGPFSIVDQIKTDFKKRFDLEPAIRIVDAITHTRNGKIFTLVDETRKKPRER